MRQLTLPFRRQSDRQRVQQHLFLLSGFTDHEKARLAESITRLGGKYLDSKVFVPDCTHVVSVRPMRSEKYLCGCASGKWIVTPAFVSESLAAGYWLDEGPYVWGNAERVTPGDATPPMEGAPARWVNHLRLTKRRAFAGWTVGIQVSGNNNRPAVYKRLIECGGGAVLSLRGPLRELDKLAKLLNYIFVDKCFEEKVRPLRDQGVPCLAPEFIAEFLFEPSPNEEKYNISSYVPEAKQKAPTASSNLRKTGSKKCPSVKAGCPSDCGPATATTALRTTQQLSLSQSSSYTAESLVFTSSSQSSMSQASTTASSPAPKRRRRAAAPTPGGRCPPGPTLASGAVGPAPRPASSVADVAVKRRLEFSPSLVQETIADIAKKHSAGHYTRVPYWMQVQPPRYQDAKMTSRPFPVVISNLIEAYLEEDFWLRAVQSIHIHLSARTYPPPALMHVIMSKFLESTDVAFLNHAIHLLKSVLCLHRPSTPEMAQVYLQSFVPSDDAGSFGLESDDPIDSPWDFIGSVIRKSLQKPRKDAEPKDTDQSSAKAAALRRSSELLLGYIVALLEQDYQAHTYWEETEPKKRKARHCLLSTILWPSHRINASSSAARQLITFMLQAVIMVEESPTMYPCLKMVTSLVEIAAECCRTAAGDRSILGDLDYGAHQDLAEEIVTMATQIGLTDKTEALNILLSLLQPDWLKLKVTDILFRGYDDSLVPEEHRQLASEPLSLKKVVNYCFYLIPPIAKKIPPSGGTADVKEELTGSNVRKRPHCQDNGPAAPLKTLATSNNIDKKEPFSVQLDRRSAKKFNKVNSRNMRGETPLHVACIRNDAAKVRDLLTCPAVQVNLTDYAGWTPLHEAANHGHVDCVRELLKYRPKQKITAYFTLDKTKRCQDALDLLSAPAQCGTTPLHDAVNNGHVEVAQLLVQAGGKAVLIARNKQGETALDVARGDAMRSALELTEQDTAAVGPDASHNKENTVTNPEGQKSSGILLETPPKRLCDDADGTSARPITEERYSAVLGTQQDPRVFFSAPQCEQFCLLVCHLLQACLRAHQLVPIRAGLRASGSSLTGVDDGDTATHDDREPAVQYALSSTRAVPHPSVGRSPQGPGGRLMDDLTEMSQLEAHLAGFVHHLGRIGPWVGSHRGNVCHKVIYDMKVLVAACL